MRDYILLMHDDVPGGLPRPRGEWAAYIAKLQNANVFQGGSSIGEGVSMARSGAGRPLTSTVAGYIRVNAVDLDAARALVIGNPVYEAGGTVEIRELPRDD
jgi:hypothetical protein